MGSIQFPVSPNFGTTGRRSLLKARLAWALRASSRWVWRFDAPPRPKCRAITFPAARVMPLQFGRSDPIHCLRSRAAAG